MQPKETEYSTNGLPKAFLHSLRTLFDILDDAGRGYVHISEIESRWQGADTRDLPGGVLSCLRRVTPPHGCLTFERFVAGLRYSMLNPENSAHCKAQAAVHPQQAPKQPHKPAPLSGCGAGTRVENKPNSDGLGQITADRPGLTEWPKAQSPGCCHTVRQLSLSLPRGGKSGLPRSQSESATGFSGSSRRNGRSREEQRRHTISNGVDYGLVAAPMVVSRVRPRGLEGVEDSLGRPGPAWTAVWAAYTIVFIPLSSGLYSSKALHFFLWLKQMKELEQEKDSLLAGLEAVERARDWYQGQIHNVTERQRQVGQNSQCTDFFTEATQSRMNVLIPKLQEVNRCLNDLITCSGVEVTEKSERIAQLEKEKSALIKQLFEARARSAQDSSTLDSTFI
ncbi:unnamed protein product [Tetraodon nigroviridis]|uniref:(spotted green pufferfish) hypothetical protein n=1 Tax=Tetraodon nigroviridis TaxID=99883 RepID=Q4SJK0_TETNG|nr:unnamed protein product [Tetraodon nigroviridis]